MDPGQQTLLRFDGSRKAVFLLFLLAALFFQPSFALGIGLLVGIFFGNPFSIASKKWTKYLLQSAIIGLGFGMNFGKVIDAGKDGFVLTLLTLAMAIGFGHLLGRMLKVERVISYLISVGTAICGGSAIAAVSQVLEADEKQISVSIGAVFILNAIALFIFPWIGIQFGLTQEQFGLWSAIAIHDTSSVVGAAANYGNESLMIATTVKLARALWIVPITLLTAFIFKKRSATSSFPWFIVLFIIASLISTYAQFPTPTTNAILSGSKVAFSLTLYLIGTGISLTTIREVGTRPLLQAVFLWVTLLVVSLVIISNY